MTGAQKRDALFALATEAERAGLGMVDAALTQIAALDLDDPMVCAKWADACDVEVDETRLHASARRVAYRRAAEILRKVTL